MFINSIPVGNISTSVWAAAVRSLTVDPATNAGAATLVWAFATRKLTGFGTALTITSAVDTNILTGVTVTFAPAANIVRKITIGARPGGGGGTMGVGLTDGTVFFQQLALIVAQIGTMTFSSTDSVCYAYVKNGNANTSDFAYSASDWKI